MHSLFMELFVNTSGFPRLSSKFALKSFESTSSMNECKKIGVISFQRGFYERDKIELYLLLPSNLSTIKTSYEFSKRLYTQCYRLYYPLT